MILNYNTLLEIYFRTGNSVDFRLLQNYVITKTAFFEKHISTKKNLTKLYISIYETHNMSSNELTYFGTDENGAHFSITS